MDKQRLQELAGVQLNENKDNIFKLIEEALDAGIYAIEHPDSDQKFAIDAMRDVLNRIHKYGLHKNAE